MGHRSGLGRAPDPPRPLALSALGTPEHWQEVKLALGEALERDSATREAFLGDLHSSNPEIAREVRSLLGWYEGSPGLLSDPDAAPARRPLAAGRRLGPYEIEELLGMGGMGTVYRARDARLGRRVAVKVLADADAGASALRFEREARAVASLSHPNLLSLFDYGHSDGMAYAVTELLQGESLRERLRRGRLPFAEALSVGRQIATGLAAAHAQGVVHRDLKPENVFLCADATVKILDFGLAKLTSPLAHSAGSSLTQAGMLMGTVGYMAPEQVRGQNVDARADVFAFGVTLHEMLVGRRPFDRDTPAETLAAVLRDEPALANGVAIPAPIIRLLHRCLAKAPDARFASGQELLLAFEEIRGLRWRDRSLVSRRGAFATVLAAALAVGGSAFHEDRLPLRPVDFRIVVGKNPDGLAFEGGNVWVANKGSNSVTRIRAQDGRVTGTYPVGEEPVAVAWDGANIWVANQKWLAGDYSTLLKLHPADGRVLATYHLPGQPMHLAVDRDHIWVTETWPTYVLRKMRLSDGETLGAYTASGTPRQLVADGTSVWVSNVSVGFVSKVRASDGKVLLSRDVGGFPAELRRVGDFLWTDNQAGLLYKLRADDLEIVARFPHSGAVGLTVSQRWVFSAEPGRIVQRRAEDARPVAVWAAGSNPNRVAFDGVNLWAADWDSGTVSMVSGRSLDSVVSQTDTRRAAQ
jgi:hypothetical protein